MRYKMPGKIHLSRKAEDYLEAIYVVSREKGYARTKDVAAELRVSPSSVVEMFRKLDKQGLVRYRKYEGVVPNPEGLRIGKMIKSRHDTLKAFFMRIGVPEDIADEDACMMEHELNPRSIEQIQFLLNFVDERADRSYTFADFEAYCRVRRFEEAKNDFE
jgi:DtxR family Mn-dependent transcriptional regulator